MNNVVNLESREAKLNSAIDADVEAIVSKPEFSLPKADTALVRYYVDKIREPMMSSAPSATRTMRSTCSTSPITPRRRKKAKSAAASAPSWTA